jgi:hypothetical protein
MIKEKKREVNTSSTSHREFQRMKDKTENKGPRNQKKKEKHQSSKNNSASLTPVQGPSTEVCIVVTSLSQLSH